MTKNDGSPWFSARALASFNEMNAFIAQHEREHPPLPTLDATLDWIDQLRDVFGEPAVDQEPWQGDDFRL